MSVRWEDIGIYHAVRVRDLWSHQDLGLIPEEYSTSVPAHGVVMLRVSR